LFSTALLAKGAFWTAEHSLKDILNRDVFLV
jgi:hypothetical protein